MTITQPRSGAPCNALSHGVREELVNDMKTAGTMFSMNTIGNTLHCNGLKTSTPRMVPMFKKLHMQVHLNFAGEHIIHSEKCCSQIKLKLSSLASTALRGQWTGLYAIKSWTRTSFPQPEHCRWVIDGSSSMAMTHNIHITAMMWPSQSEDES